MEVNPQTHKNLAAKAINADFAYPFIREFWAYIYFSQLTQREPVKVDAVGTYRLDLRDAKRLCVALSKLISHFEKEHGNIVIEIPKDE